MAQTKVAITLPVEVWMMILNEKNPGHEAAILLLQEKLDEALDGIATQHER
jgi:hypothetical protein